MTAITEARAPGKTPNLRVVLPGLMLAILLAMLDNFIVGTAMPRIVQEFHGLTHRSWVVTAYVLGTTVSTPLWGKIGDLYGRKSIFLTSIVLFLLGSALCGFSQNMTELIAFRAFQGLGAGGLMVGAMAIIGDLVPPRERGKYQGMMAAIMGVAMIAMAIIGDLVPPRERGKYQGMMAAIMGVAMIAGPFIGGFITDNADWR